MRPQNALFLTVGLLLLAGLFVLVGDSRAAQAAPLPVLTQTAAAPTPTDTPVPPPTNTPIPPTDTPVPPPTNTPGSAPVQNTATPTPAAPGPTATPLPPETLPETGSAGPFPTTALWLLLAGLIGVPAVLFLRRVRG